MHIPDDVVTTVTRRREEELARAARDAARDEQRARARARERERALEPARRILAFARELAVVLPLPPNGLEVFVLWRGRSSTRVRVRPDGSLLLSTHAAYGGGRRSARTESELANMQLDLVLAVADAIETGAVWDHVRGGGY